MTAWFARYARQSDERRPSTPSASIENRGGLLVAHAHRGHPLAIGSRDFFVALMNRGFLRFDSEVIARSHEVWW